MATQDRGLGPLVGQTVLYNDAGVVKPGIIYGVNANGSVNISQIFQGALTDRASIGFDAGLGTSRWAYPQVI